MSFTHSNINWRPFRWCGRMTSPNRGSTTTGDAARKAMGRKAIEGATPQCEGIRCQVSGIRCQVSGARCQVSSVRCQ